MATKNNLSKGFLLFMVIASLIACYAVFRPFMNEILIAMILVTIFYTPYEKLTRVLKGRAKISSFLMCTLVLLVVVVPLVNFIAYGAQQSVEAYTDAARFFSNNPIDTVVKETILSKFKLVNIGTDSLTNIVITLANKISIVFYEGASKFLIGTTGFILSLVWILIAMFFFFMDGKKMLERAMYLTPLPNKYDIEIFTKFKDVSVSIIISTFLTAMAQGLLGAIGFAIVGLPTFFAGIFMAIMSLVPYVGTATIWLPTSIYLLVTGQIWQGLFLMTWGALVVSFSDNFIKAYLIKDKAQVHPVFVLFSLLGGIILFKFWGIVFGPMIIAITVTILHIYEKEYKTVLEK